MPEESPPRPLNYAAPDGGKRNLVRLTTRRICGGFVGGAAAFSLWTGARCVGKLHAGTIHEDGVRGFVVGTICAFAFVRWLMVEYKEFNQ